MGRDFVEEKDRWIPAPISHEIGMGKDEPEEERLLLTGRAEGSVDIFCGMADQQVLTVRAGERPACRGVPVASAAQLPLQVPMLPIANREGGARKRILRCHCEMPLQRFDCVCTALGDGSPMLRHLHLQGIEPDGVGGGRF